MKYTISTLWKLQREGGVRALHSQCLLWRRAAKESKAWWHHPDRQPVDQHLLSKQHPSKLYSLVYGRMGELTHQSIRAPRAQVMPRLSSESHSAPMSCSLQNSWTQQNIFNGWHSSMSQYYLSMLIINMFKTAHFLSAMMFEFMSQTSHYGFTERMSF